MELKETKKLTLAAQYLDISVSLGDYLPRVTLVAYNEDSEALGQNKQCILLLSLMVKLGL